MLEQKVKAAWSAFIAANDPSADVSERAWEDLHFTERNAWFSAFKAFFAPTDDPQPVQEQCPECDGTGTVAGSQAHFPCPICTSPQAQPQPVREPLSRYREKCADGSWCLHGCLSAEACYTAPQPQPVQEPVAPVGTVTRYLGNDGYMKWAFQPEAAAWLVPRDQRAAECGAESRFSVYTSPQAQPLTEADPFTYVIQHLNSSPYALTKDECITKIKELRAIYQAQGEAK